MEYRTLKDIAKITMGQSPDSSSYNKEKDGLPFFQGNADFGELYPNERIWCNEPKKVAIPGDILISVRAPIGALNYAKEKSCIGRGLAAITIKNVVERNYIFHLLRARNKYLNSKGTGSTFKAIGKNVLEEVLVPQISREEQQKCVNVIDLIESIIIERKSQIDKLDELVRARFVEMFGDLKNTIRLGDCCKVHARIGWQALTRDEHMKTGEYMLVTGTDFIDGKINYNTCVYVTKERYEMDPHIILRDNDILITKDGSIGKVAIIHNLSKPATLNSGVFVVRPKDIFNKEYISGVFRGPLFEKFIELSKTGATIKHLNQKHLVEFRIPLPTLEKQEVFAGFSNQVNKSKLLAASQPQIHIYKTLTLL